MTAPLLERSAEQAILRAAVDHLLSGTSGVILLGGEAGIGKTSLLRDLRGNVDPRVRVLAGTCDDLIAANALGPLREAFGSTANHRHQRVRPEVDAALAGGRLEDVLPALAAEFTANVPTLLMVEDLHWADDATLDALGYLARRVDQLALLLLLTYRDDETGPEHSVQRLFAATPSRLTTRITLHRLSVESVEVLSAGSGWDSHLLHEITGGNPFYVSETLAAPADAPVPRTVADAVLARLQSLSPASREAVEQISVWPGVLEYSLAEALLDRGLEPLAEAEAAGVVVASESGLSFRHELARRATEASLSRLRQRHLQQRVTLVLRAQRDIDPSRLVHHAIHSADAATIVEFAPLAGKQSAAAGAHRQALVFFAAALRSADLITPPGLADLLYHYAWELYNANRFGEAVDAGARAVQLFRELGQRTAEAEALVRLSRYLFMQGRPDQAQAAAAEAVVLSVDSPAAMVDALAARGALLALDARADEAVDVLRRAEHEAVRSDRADLEALSLNYASLARRDLSAAERVVLLRRSLDVAYRGGAYEAVARGYTNLGEMLYRYGRYQELADLLPEALSFTRERGFWSHAFNLEVHDCLLAARRGDWGSAEIGLSGLVRRYIDPGMLMLYCVPPYARLLARRGSPEAEQLLRQAWTRALSQRMLIGLGFAGAALMEWAWLNDAPEIGRQVLTVFAEHRDRPAAEPLHAEICRYAQRLGLPAPASDSESADPWLPGLAGRWQEAAAAWAAIGDPYEEALELADSGEVEPSLRALALLDGLGARPAAHKLRLRLKQAGVRTLPRGPLPQTRSNPGGLTARQLDIMAMLGEGLTNAEIAARLVLSVRTVDHHVSSLLTKLGVANRRDAARLAREWQLRSTSGLG